MVLWKIYSYLFALINLYSIVVIYIVLAGAYPFDLTSILSLLLSVSLNIISFYYSYSKKISNSFVKTIFFLNLFFIVLYILSQTLPPVRSLIGTSEEYSISVLTLYLIGTIPSVPALYICYKLISVKKKR